MKHGRRIHIITVLLFLAVAETGRAQTTNSLTSVPGRQPGYPMGTPTPSHEKPAVAPGTTTEVVLHSFATPPRGVHPGTGVIRSSVGNLYGTANGGPAGQGVVFGVDPSGHEALLYTFTGGADGGAPNGVIADSADNLYGTATYGGASNSGVVFRIDITGRETVLYSFTGGADGGYPNASVVRDSAGNLYGATAGGADGSGVVYKVNLAGQQTVLYTFTGGADGSSPNGVILDSSGNLYGTTQNGGASGAGVVYKLDTNGNETVLYSFTGGSDGSNPQAAVIRDAAGNLYGTTNNGGASGKGVVFKVSSSGTETALYSFTGGSDGSNPQGPLIRDSAGNFYGTTNSGGASGVGVVFELDPAGNETVLYTFAGGIEPDGAYPAGNVIRDANGNLYGTAYWGGAANQGVVYKVDTSGQGTVVYSFPGPVDGQLPDTGVTRDAAGNLYGTAQWGGRYGWGVVYKLDPSGHDTVLHAFTGGADGSTPYAGVILDAECNVYGTTQLGGAANAGVVYKIDTAGHETVLYSFTGGTDGGKPVGGVIRDAARNLYGTTQSGGASGAGVVFKLDPSGEETVLYTFTGGSDGANPNAGVIRDAEGNLYGTAEFGGASGAGVVFMVDPSGNETVLWSFTWGNDGALPLAGLTRDSAGNLYGTTLIGGADFAGAVFMVDPSGQETTLWSFTGGADGGYPLGGVIRDPSGNLYGTTNGGGASYSGVVFKVDPSGNETVLYSFTGGNDGAYPYSTLIFDPAGNLYGNARSSVESSGSPVTHSTTPFSAWQLRAWAAPTPPTL